MAIQTFQEFYQVQCDTCDKWLQQYLGASFTHFWAVSDQMRGGIFDTLDEAKLVARNAGWLRQDNSCDCEGIPFNVGGGEFFHSGKCRVNNAQTVIQCPDCQENTHN